MLTRYFIFISYKGTSYCGWQVQPNSFTVQKVLNDALSTVLREKISATGAGRTDTGVHARNFCAHFDSSSNDLHKWEVLVHRLNGYLPSDIAVNYIKKVNDSAHARFSAISRTYMYYIALHKDPFRSDTSWFLPGKPDIDLMNRACEILLMHNDFTSFSRLHSGAKTNICKIYSAGWKEEDSFLVFTIRADRFLRNMVRAIVGTMVDVGRGKTSIQGFEEIIFSRNRKNAGSSAPAKGLFLTSIEYPGEIFTGQE